MEIIVDSSKRIGTLKRLAELYKQKSIQLFPVFLIRDVRGWALSAQKRRPEKTLLFFFLRWYIENRRIKCFLKKMPMPFQQISYWMVCTEPDVVFKKIFLWVGEAENFSSKQKISDHIAYSNRMKKDFSKLSDLRLNNAWRMNRPVRWLFLLLFPICIWNWVQVYRHALR